MDKKVLAYNLTESISEASKGSLAYVINPNHDGMSVLVSADALKALADSHDDLAQCVTQYLADYDREFNESEDDDIIRGMRAAITKAESK